MRIAMFHQKMKTTDQKSPLFDALRTVREMGRAYPRGESRGRWFGPPV